METDADGAELRELGNDRITGRDIVSTRPRLLIVTAFLLLTAAYLAHASKSEPVPIRQSLATCPLNISDWTGRHAEDLDEKTLSILGVDEYLNRVYLNKRKKPVGLYIGYYGSQRQGDTMHSPLNCLPGAGYLTVCHLCPEDP